VPSVDPHVDRAEHALDVIRGSLDLRGVRNVRRDAQASAVGGVRSRWRMRPPPEGLIAPHRAPWQGRQRTSCPDRTEILRVLWARAADLGTPTATGSLPGPDAIHLLRGLYDAVMDHPPVVAIVGSSCRSLVLLLDQLHQERTYELH